MSSIGDRLKALRGATSQAQIARELGMKQPQYARYESGASSPSADILIKMCDVFLCSADDILGTHRGERGASLINQSVSGNHNTLTATVGAPGEMAMCKSCPKVAELKVGLENLLQTAKMGAAKVTRRK